MPEARTKPIRQTVAGYLKEIDDDARRKEVRAIIDLLTRVTGEKPTFWTGSLIGFGKYRYQYASGREGESALIGCAARKDRITLYVMSGFDREPLMKKLGKHTKGKCCLHIRRLSDVDLPTLEKIVSKSVELVRSGKVCL
jgi:hypothetical protein